MGRLESRKVFWVLGFEYQNFKLLVLTNIRGFERISEILALPLVIVRSNYGKFFIKKLRNLILGK